MRFGLTYDVRDDYLAQGYALEAVCEFDSPATIDAIEAVLKKRGFDVERIGNIEALTQALAQGKRWDGVFNIAEGMHGPAREAQVPALLDAYSIPYVFSGVLTLALTLDKAMAKRVVAAGNIPTAAFMVAEGEADIAEAKLPYPMFVKPLYEGTGKGISQASIVADKKQLMTQCRDIWARFGQPALVEKYLSGREFTVGITGTGAAAQVVAVMEFIPRDKDAEWVYSFANKQNYEEAVEYRLAEDEEAKNAAKVALAAWNALQCRDGGRVDVRSDRSRLPHFIEVNPLAGLHPEDGDLVILSRLAGISYETLLNRIIDSALNDASRFPQKAPNKKHA